MKRQKKKKFSIKKTLRLAIPLLLIILGVILFINKDNIYTYYLTKTTGYDELTITAIKDNNNDIKKRELSTNEIQIYKLSDCQTILEK